MTTDDQRLADLEQLVAGLRRNFVRVVRILDDVAKPKALDRSMIEVCATKMQEKAFYDLMDEVATQLALGQPAISRDAFARRVYSIFPLKEDDKHSPEGFVIAAARDGRWRSVYEYLQHQGTNLPASFDDLETAE